MDKPKKNMTRLCVLIPPDLKAAFEQACGRLDLTAAQVVRQLVKRWTESDGALLERPYGRR